MWFKPAEFCAVTSTGHKMEDTTQIVENIMHSPTTTDKMSVKMLAKQK